MLLVGFSGYPQSGHAGLDQIINAMNLYQSNCYRISFNPIYQSTASRPYVPEYVDYYLNHTPENYSIVVDGSHHYGEDDVQWNQVQTRALDVCSRWPNNPRVLVEIVNEPPWRYPIYSNVQPIINAIRNANYTNAIVMNKFNPRENWQRFTDPYDNTYQGIHLFINQYPLDGSGTAGMSWVDLMEGAINAGITKMLNTEVGADYRENQYFTQAEVTELNQMLQYCAGEEIGNNVWLRIDTYNLATYQNLGLVMPVPPVEQPPPPPPTYYNVYIYSSIGGVCDPTGLVKVNRNTNLTITATPQVDYEFDHWEIDGYIFNQNPITLLVDHDAITVYAFFNYVSPPPPVNYNVYIYATEGGNVLPNGTVPVPAGENLVIQAYPNEGYEFDHWAIAGQSYTQNPITLIVDHDAITVYGFFKPIIIPPPPAQKFPWELVPALLTGAATYAATENAIYGAGAGLATGLFFRQVKQNG